MQKIASKKEIAERLKSLRKNQGLSQQDISSILGISRSNYSQIEMGKQFPSYPSLVILSRYYSKSYNWLLHGTEEIDNNVPLVKLDTNSGTLEKVLHPFIPMVSQAGHAEYIRLCQHVNFINQLPLLCFPLKEQNGIYRAFEIATPIQSLGLNSHDTVLAKRVHKPTAIVTGKIYLFITDHSMVIDRIAANPKTEHQVILVEKKLSLSYRDLKEIWCIIAKYTSEFKMLEMQLMQQLDRYDEILHAIQTEISVLRKSKG